MHTQKIFDNFIYITDKNFTFQLQDGKGRQFGILFEIVNMSEATGEKQFKDFPFVVTASVVADKCHRSFDESSGGWLNKKKWDKLSLIYDAYQYMGGIPIDHTLTHDIRGGTEDMKGDNFSVIAERFSPEDACAVTDKQDFGTVAAQKGKGSEIKYLQFRTQDIAERFVNYLITHRIPTIGMTIGFILDCPINLAGTTGWDVLEGMVNGR